MISNIKHVPIVPINLLNVIEDNYTIHMALAHLTKHSEYKDFYRKQSEKGNFVILDNSIVELGKAVDIDYLLSVAQDIRAHELIFPDVFDDAEKTLQEAKKAMVKFKGITHIRKAAVCQGKNLKEISNCAKELINLGIDTICIPKRSTLLNPNARAIITKSIDKLVGQSKVQVHWLGVWNNLIEIYNFYNEFMVDLEFTKVRSCDTQWAALVTKNNYSVCELQETNLTNKIITRENFIHTVLSLKNPGYLHEGKLKNNLSDMELIFDAEFFDWSISDE